MMGATRAKVGLVCLSLAISVLAGCATSLDTLPPTYVLQDQGNAVVMGRFEYQYKEGKKPWGSDSWLFKRLSGSTLYAEDLKTGKDYAIHLDGDWTDFWVEMPPSRYRIKKWVSGKLESGELGRFDVTGGKVVYIGTLRFVRKQGAGSFAQQVLLGTIPGEWSVSNEYEQAAKTFHEKYPRIDQEIVTSLIELY